MQEYNVTYCGNKYKVIARNPIFAVRSVVTKKVTKKIKTIQVVAEIPDRANCSVSRMTDKNKELICYYTVSYTLDD